MTLNETNAVKFSFLIENKTAPFVKIRKLVSFIFAPAYIGIVFAIVQNMFYWFLKNSH